MSGETSFMHLVRPNVSAPAASSANGPAIIKIHTSALFQILEIISKQVLSENTRIIGSLLGIRSDDGSEFEVRDAFMVPCDDTGDSIVTDDSVHKTFYQLYKKAHPKENVLGWFGSSSIIDSSTGLIHDLYSKGSDRAFPFPAIYLNVEFLTKDFKIKLPTISTYIGASIGKPQQPQPQQIGWKTVTNTNSYIFTPIPNKIINSNSTEKLTFNLLKQKSINVDSITLESNLSFLNQQLNAVQQTIDQLLNNIDENNNSDENLNLLRLLSNQLLNKPKILADLNGLTKLFMAHNQDVVMIEYLTKAIKEQIELSARLTASAEADKNN